MEPVLQRSESIRAASAASAAWAVFADRMRSWQSIATALSVRAQSKCDLATWL